MILKTQAIRLPFPHPHAHLYNQHEITLSDSTRSCDCPSGRSNNLKRPQDPTDGTPKGFGFCEFESAEGVLRALRLLSKFNIDGQELVVCLGFHCFLCLFKFL